MNDMKDVIIPRSDQRNADDLLSGPMTIKITKVAIRPGTEQPVSVFYEGDEGKPWKPCKSMARVLVFAWGADSSKYVGRSVTLYCDKTVKWGGMEVGGIRISHMSDIDSSITMALTATRGNKRPFTVRPLEHSTAAAQVDAVQSGASLDQPDAAATIYVTPDQAMDLEAWCTELGLGDAFKKKAGVERFSLLLAADLEGARMWIAKRAAKMKEEAA